VQPYTAAWSVSGDLSFTSSQLWVPYNTNFCEIKFHNWTQNILFSFSKRWFLLPRYYITCINVNSLFSIHSTIFYNVIARDISFITRSMSSSKPPITVISIWWCTKTLLPWNSSHNLSELDSHTWLWNVRMILICQEIVDSEHLVFDPEHLEHDPDWSV